MSRVTWCVVACFAVVGVGGLAGGCFPGPLPATDAVEDTGGSGDTAVETDTAVASDTAVVPDTSSETDTVVVSDTTVETDATVADTSDTSVTPDVDASDTTIEVDVGPTCDDDDECTDLTAAPCVVGRCVEHACQAVNVNVPCDDDDPCTTDDKCGQGACKGRAFNAAESESWSVRIGGAGEDSVIGVVAHPSGDVTVVGAFDQAISIGDTLLTPTGKLDLWAARFTSGGDVLWAKAFGQDGFNQVPIGLYESGDDALMVWGSTASDQPGPGDIAWTSTKLRSFAPSSVGGGAVYGTFAAADALANGDLVVLARIEVETEIPLATGGSITLDPNDGTNGVVMVISASEVVRTVVLEHVVWESSIQRPSLERVGGSARVIVSLGADGAVGGAPASGSIAFDVDASRAGAVGAPPAEWDALLSLSRVESGAPAFSVLEALVPFEEVEGPDDLRLHHGIASLGATTLACTGDFALAALGDVPAADGLRLPTGYFVTVLAEPGSWHFGDGVDLEVPTRSTVLARFDEGCRAVGAVTFNVTYLDEAPPHVNNFLPALTAAHRLQMRADRRGGVAFARTIKESFTAPAPLDSTFVGVAGTADGFVGRLAAPWIYNCGER